MLQRNREGIVEYCFAEDDPEFPEDPVICCNHSRLYHQKIELFLDGVIPKIQTIMTSRRPRWNLNREHLPDEYELFSLVYNPEHQSRYGGLPFLKSIIEGWLRFEFFFFEGEIYLFRELYGQFWLHEVTSRRPEEDWEKLNEILSPDEDL